MFDRVSMLGRYRYGAGQLGWERDVTQKLCGATYSVHVHFSLRLDAVKFGEDGSSCGRPEYMVCRAVRVFIGVSGCDRARGIVSIVGLALMEPWGC